jgi:hypothetical protein
MLMHAAAFRFFGERILSGFCGLEMAKLPSDFQIRLLELACIQRELEQARFEMADKMRQRMAPRCMLYILPFIMLNRPLARFGFAVVEKDIGAPDGILTKLLQFAVRPNSEQGFVAEREWRVLARIRRTRMEGVDDSPADVAQIPDAVRERPDPTGPIDIRHRRQKHAELMSRLRIV